jgi:hypothetical protein
MNDTTADTMAITSLVSAAAHTASQWQPIISFIAGVVAILSGVLAIVYYIRKMK